jgi:hypothetical protein
MRIRLFSRIILCVVLLAGVSCTLLKPHHVLTARANPIDFVMNKIDTACFSRAELEQLRAHRDYVTIAFDELILDTLSHCVGLYRYALSEKPSWPAVHGIKCYLLKFKDKIEIADQVQDRMAVLDSFFAQYGKLFTEAQQQKIRTEYMSDCVLIQGE